MEKDTEKDSAGDFVRLDLVALINIDRFEMFDETIRALLADTRNKDAAGPYIVVNGLHNTYTYGQFLHAYRRGCFNGRDEVILFYDDELCNNAQRAAIKCVSMPVF